MFLISVFSRVILGRHNQPPPLPSAPVHGLYDVDQLLLVLHGPVDLVIVTGAQVNHDVLVPGGVIHTYKLTILFSINT